MARSRTALVPRAPLTKERIVGAAVALPLRAEQGGAPRRDDRRRLRRDRAPAHRSRVARRNAPARVLDPRGAEPPPLGSRADGVPENARTRQRPPPRRRS